MRPVHIRVYGIPAPQGSKVRTRWGGMREASKRLPAWRQAIRDAATEYVLANHRLPIIDPVRMHVVFYLPRPKSVPVTRRLWPSVKPDYDKLARSLDSLTDAGLILDDSLIVTAYVSKLYADDVQPPGATICLQLEESPKFVCKCWANYA